MWSANVRCWSKVIPRYLTVVAGGIETLSMVSRREEHTFFRSGVEHNELGLAGIQD